MIIYALTSLERSAAGKFKFAKQPDNSLQFLGGDWGISSPLYPRESVPRNTVEIAEIAETVETTDIED